MAIKLSRVAFPGQLSGGAISFSGAGTNYLLAADDVQEALVALDTELDNLAAVVSGIPGNTDELVKVRTAGTADFLENLLVAGTNVTLDVTNNSITINAATGGGAPDLSGSTLSELSDVSTATASDGQVLTWSDIASKWQPTTPSGGGIALTDLSVTTAAASGGGSLSYNNGTGVFTFTPADVSGGGATELNELTDVTLGVNPGDLNYPLVSGQVLFYNGSQWVNDQPRFQDLANWGDLDNLTTLRGKYLQVSPSSNNIVAADLPTFSAWRIAEITETATTAQLIFVPDTLTSFSYVIGNGVSGEGTVIYCQSPSTTINLTTTGTATGLVGLTIVTPGDVNINGPAVSYSTIYADNVTLTNGPVSNCHIVCNNLYTSSSNGTGEINQCKIQSTGIVRQRRGDITNSVISAKQVILEGYSSTASSPFFGNAVQCTTFIVGSFQGTTTLKQDILNCYISTGKFICYRNADLTTQNTSVQANETTIDSDSLSLIPTVRLTNSTFSTNKFLISLTFGSTDNIIALAGTTSLSIETFEADGIAYLRKWDGTDIPSSFNNIVKEPSVSLSVKSAASNELSAYDGLSGTIVGHSLVSQLNTDKVAFWQFGVTANNQEVTLG